MKPKQLFALLLCAAALLPGCGAAPAGPAGSAEHTQSDTGQPLSELERLELQTRAWEEAGCYDDEEAYREALVRTAELARREDRGTYRCEIPGHLDARARSALADAVVACNLVYSVSPQFDPFGANLSESMSLLLCGIGDTPELDIINNREEPEDPSLPKGLYYMMREADIQPFLERTLIPAAQAYREHRDEMLDWGWLAGEDGIVYVEEIENPDTLRFGDPFLVSVEPLGGDRYLVVEELRDALGQWMYQIAIVAEDIAPPDAPPDEMPRVTVLDCVSAAWSNSGLVTPEELDVLRDKYWVSDCPEAVVLLERLEALSPIPYHTDLAADASPALLEALEDALVADEMINSGSFEDFAAALTLSPDLYRAAPEDEWRPADPEYGILYGDAWNLVSAERLEDAFRRQFGWDLAANGRAWMDNREFVPLEYESQQPMVQYDGENYIIYIRGRGGPIIFPYEVTLTYGYDGAYTAQYLEHSGDYFGSGNLYSLTRLRLRNVGTAEKPFFQLQGYELPE